MSRTEKVIIDNSYRSDHSGVVLSLNLNKIHKGRGLWKFNNSLLSDKEYIKIIKDIINNIITQYAILIYNPQTINRIPKEETQFIINDGLFLETLLMEIRGKTISYPAFKKKKTNEKENILCEKIKELEESENEANIELLQKK